MEVSTKLQDKINDLAAHTFLSEGDYNDLLEAAEGDTKAIERVVLWKPFEYEEYSKVLENVDNLAEDIAILIKSL